MFREMIKTVRQIAKVNRKNNLSAYASSAAFFIFLSLIPMLMSICSMIPYTGLTEVNLIALVSEVLPASIEPFAISIINEVFRKSTAVISISALTLIWSASKGILAIMRALQVINEVEETRGYIRLRLRASFYTVLMMLGILSALILMVFGNQLLNIILGFLPRIYVAASVVVFLRYFLICSMLALLFMGLYTRMPNKKIRFTSQFPGAMLASVCWALFSWCFSLYVDHFDGFNMYGSLSTIIVVMLWLYICMYLLLLGAQVNYSLEPQIQNTYKRTKNLDRHA